MKVGWLLVVALLLSTGWASAQSTTGTIRGHVSDSQNLNLPGVTVTVTSPNLQGTRTTATSENGDYILTLLPSGIYTVAFELTGFERQQRTVSLAPTQDLPIDLTFAVANREESLQVVGTAVNMLPRTAQVATNFPQALISELPTNRDVSASLLLAPSVHQTGAGGTYSISGSFSFESLFMVNGVAVVDNVRGQPYDLYIEDAVQATSVATAGISAEYGRFTGGVVNIITKSGGNEFSGSFRDTIHNDKWRAYTPFEQKSIAADPLHRDTRISKSVPTYEYTFGGPAVKDRLWFFTSGRMQKQEAGRTLVGTGIPYVFSEDAKRFEINGTYSPSSGHRLQSVFIQNNATQNNTTQNPTTSMDPNSLYNAGRLMNLFTVSYSGVITGRMFLEARYSSRNETLKDVGGRSTDRVQGTLLIDRSGRRYWAATFCGVCDPEERDGGDLYLKGSYFLSTRQFGSHEMVVGYDGYDDKRFANNHQSGSDYRIIGTNTIIRGTGDSATIYPQFLSDGGTQIAWQPILVESQGSHFRSHSLFYNDHWRVSNRMTTNLGLRYDRNHGANSAGEIVTKGSAWSPRVGIVVDPTGSQLWSVSGSVAKYVAGIANTVADASSPGGNFDSYLFAYTGPAINGDPNGPLLNTSDALTQLFNWFDARGGAALPMLGAPTVRGVTPQINGSLESPSVWEYSTGVERQIGSRASVGADITYRDHHDFYAQRSDLSTGRVTDNRGGNVPPAVRGGVYDLTVIENTDILKRRYAGLSLQSHYRVNVTFDVGAAYTLSRLWGNVDGENANSGATANDVLQFPEYKVASWNNPEGDLAADQRHRLRAWATYGVPKVTGLSLGVLEIIESGVPYGALGTVNSAAFVSNPGYLAPPAASSINYYYTPRDAFRTEGQMRTDVAINYTRHVWPERLELFGQLQILNVFNHYQLCGCGASTVFQNGGAVTSARLDQTVRTPVNFGLPGFNPFTTTPQQGVNWNLGPAFGTGTSRLAYTTPRTIRISFGVRF